MRFIDAHKNIIGIVLVWVTVSWLPFRDLIAVTATIDDVSCGPVDRRGRSEMTITTPELGALRSAAKISDCALAQRYLGSSVELVMNSSKQKFFGLVVAGHTVLHWALVPIATSVGLALLLLCGWFFFKRRPNGDDDVRDISD